jgi:preprotein translocase subunit SecD
MIQRVSITLLGISLIAAAGCARLSRPRRPVRELVIQIVAPPDNREAAMDQTIKTITNRLTALGDNADVKPESAQAGLIRVSVWQTADVARLKQIITAAGKLEMTHVMSDPNPAPVKTYATKEAAAESADMRDQVTPHRVLPCADRKEISGSGSETSAPTKWVVVESSAIIDGGDLRSASAVANRNQNDYEIAFSLNKNGAEKFGNWTAAHINEYLAVVLNDEVRSIAYIRSQIADQGEITGSFTKQSAEDLALVLKSGSLPYPVKVVDDRVPKQN